MGKRLAVQCHVYAAKSCCQAGQAMLPSPGSYLLRRHEGYQLLVYMDSVWWPPLRRDSLDMHVRTLDEPNLTSLSSSVFCDNQFPTCLTNCFPCYNALQRTPYSNKPATEHVASCNCSALCHHQLRSTCDWDSHDLASHHALTLIV